MTKAIVPTRILYTMIRVTDLERSIRFYVDHLGMQEMRREDYPSGRFTLAFLGYGDEDQHAVVELTWNWDPQDYDLGNAWGHIALGVEDVAASIEKLRDGGVTILRDAGPMMHRSPQRSEVENIAFFADPDGYRIELVEI